ncbi:MAG: porin, partial [Leptospiraceae bacterium]|nr:porin [Leptospiraceae bacterium]
SGFQLGLSFTPDEGDGGTASGFTGNNNGDMENVIGAGLNWSGDFDAIGIQLGAVGQFGSAEVSGTEDLSAWQLGSVISFGSVSIAGSYGDLGDSGQAVGSDIDTSFWTAGVAYAQDVWGISATYLDSEVGSNDYTSLVLGADYSLAPGLTPYIEATFFEADEGGTTLDNDGTIVLVGTYLNF